MNTELDPSRTQGSSEENAFSSTEISEGTRLDVDLFDQLWKSLFYETSGDKWRQEVIELSQDEEQEGARALFDEMLQELGESPILELGKLDNCSRFNHLGEEMEEYWVTFSHTDSLVQGEIAIREIMSEGSEVRTDVVLKTVLWMERIEDRLLGGESQFEELRKNVSIIDQVKALALKEGWSCFSSKDDGYRGYFVGLCFQLKGAAPHQIEDAVSLFERAVGVPDDSLAPNDDLLPGQN